MRKVTRAFSGLRKAVEIARHPNTIPATVRHLVRIVTNGDSGIYDISRPLDETRKTIILVPGFASDGASMKGLAETLGERSNVYSPDNFPKGFGAVFRWMTLEEEAVKLAQYTDRFVSEHSFASDIYFVGHSNGGIAALLALHHLSEKASNIIRNKVKSLITMASPVSPQPDYYLGDIPLISGIPAVEHLRADSKIYRTTRLYHDRVALCIASREDELFPLNMQLISNRPSAIVDFSHWGYTQGSANENQQVAGLIQGAISSSLSTPSPK